MNNNNLENSNKTSDIRRPTFGEVVRVIILATIVTIAAFVAVRFADIILFIPFFATAVALQTYLLYFVRNPFTLLIPCAASFVCMPDFLPAVICLSAILVCSGLFTVLLMRRAESFYFFMISALLYSVLAGAAFVLMMVNVFDSFAAGLDYITQTSVEFVSAMFASYDKKVVEIMTDVAQTVPYYIPTFIFGVGVFTSWITKWILSGAASKSGVKKRLFSRITGAPVGFAIVYILLIFSGLLFAFVSESAYFASVNVQSVLSLIFMGEGIREFLNVFRKPGAERHRFTLIIIAAALIMFMPAFLVPVTAYYGAYRTIFKRIHVIKITKD